MISRVLSALAALGLVASGTAKTPQAQVKVPLASDIGIAQGTDAALDLLAQNSCSDGRPWPPPPAPPHHTVPTPASRRHAVPTPAPPHHAVPTPAPTIVG